MSSLKTCEVHPKTTHQVNQKGFILQQMKPEAPVVVCLPTQLTHLMTRVPNFTHGAQLRSQGPLDPLESLWECDIGQNQFFLDFGHLAKSAKKCTMLSCAQLFSQET